MGLENLGTLLGIDCVDLNVAVLPESETVALVQWSAWVLGIVGPRLFWDPPLPPAVILYMSLSDGANA